MVGKSRRSSSRRVHRRDRAPLTDAEIFVAESSVNSLWLEEPTSRHQQGFLLVGTGNGKLRQLSLRSHKTTREFEGHPCGFVSSFVIRGDYLLSGSSDSTVRCFDLATGKFLAVSSVHDKCVTSLVSTLDDNHGVYSGSWDGQICEWSLDKESGDWQSGLLRQCSGPVISLHTTQLGTTRCLLAGLVNGDIEARLADEMDTRVISFQGHTDFVSCIRTSEEYVFSASRDSTIRVWDLTLGGCIHIWEAPTNVGIFSLEILTVSESSRYLLAGLGDGTIHIFRIVNSTLDEESIQQNVAEMVEQATSCLEHVFVLQPHSKTVFAMKVTQDASLIYTASADKTVRQSVLLRKCNCGRHFFDIENARHHYRTCFAAPRDCLPSRLRRKLSIPRKTHDTTIKKRVAITTLRSPSHTSSSRSPKTTTAVVRRRPATAHSPYSKERNQKSPVQEFSAKLRRLGIDRFNVLARKQRSLSLDFSQANLVVEQNSKEVKERPSTAPVHRRKRTRRAIVKRLSRRPSTKSILRESKDVIQSCVRPSSSPRMRAFGSRALHKWR